MRPELPTRIPNPPGEESTLWTCDGNRNAIGDAVLVQYLDGLWMCPAPQGWRNRGVSNSQAVFARNLIKRRMGNLPDDEIVKWMRRDVGYRGEQYDLCHGLARKSLEKGNPEHTLAWALMQQPVQERDAFYLRWRMCATGYPGVTVEPTHGLAREFQGYGYQGFQDPPYPKGPQPHKGKGKGIELEPRFWAPHEGPEAWMPPQTPPAKGKGKKGGEPKEWW